MTLLAIDSANQVQLVKPGSDDGTLVGRNATTPVGFFGATPAVQPTFSAGTGTLATLSTALASLGIIKLVA
jgi:hypothetical protein